MSKLEKRVGQELLGRLERFTEQLDSIQEPSELSKILTVRKVKLNLRPTEFEASDVKEVRRLLGVSQPVFADFIGMSVGAVRDWEQGVTKPTSPVCRIMQEVLCDPDAWRRRIHELADAEPAC